MCSKNKNTVLNRKEQQYIIYYMKIFYEIYKFFVKYSSLEIYYNETTRTKHKMLVDFAKNSVMNCRDH